MKRAADKSIIEELQTANPKITRKSTDFGSGAITWPWSD